jgi:hypothetical protein
MKSIGDVSVDDIKSDVAYIKEKEKQAQIVGPLTRRTNDRINLKFLTEIDRLYLPSLYNFSTFFSPSFALEIK